MPSPDNAPPPYTLFEDLATAHRDLSRYYEPFGLLQRSTVQDMMAKVILPSLTHRPPPSSNHRPPPPKPPPRSRSGKHF